MAALPVMIANDIGDHLIPAGRKTMNSDERRELIRKYADGYRVIIEALDGASAAEMEAREAPDEWSPREIVHHLADSEMTSAIRLRRLIAEDDPEITGYDQDEFARRLYYDRPIDPSLAVFNAARMSTVDILERLTEEEWARAGRHTESGRYSVADWLQIYAVHAHEHAEQILRARATVEQG
jgi:hypothetical protein